jgi:beta-aspartyl-peptidase (threonine type)
MRIACPVLFTVLGLTSVSDDATERASIRGLLDSQVACWNRGDLEGFMRTYWNSPDLVFQSGGDRTRGWQTVFDRYHKRYRAAGQKMGTLSFSEIELELLAPEVALAKGRWKLDLPDGTHPAGLYTLILRKRPEGWRIVHDHTSLADHPKPPSPDSDPR